MGALISETVRYDQMRVSEVIEGVSGQGDDCKWEIREGCFATQRRGRHLGGKGDGCNPGQ